MTKSPLAVARTALAVARDALPTYSSKYSRKDYTQHQLFALLALREFLGTDYRGLEQMLREWAELRRALGLGKVPDHSTLQKAAPRLLEKGGPPPSWSRRSPARAGRLIGPRPRAAIDATGYETRHVSRSFAWRSGRRRQRSWPKLTAVLETGSHLFLSCHVGRGPSQDSPQFRPAARAAARTGPIDTMLGDGAYDAEHNHAYAREVLGIRSTVIPLNRRNAGRKWPKTRYRRQMVKRFRRKPRGSRHRRVHGQRWQIESAFSRNKRLLGSSLRSRRWANQKREIRLRVLTHNLMLLAAA